MRRLAAVALLLFVSVSSLEAQGKGGGNAKAKTPPGQAKKVSPDAAVVVTKEILAKHGFTFVRIENVNGAQVVYYRRGNMGNGKGLGPVEKMIIRPSNDIVVFEGGPSVVLVDVRLRLGL